jgi:hypothetical protein
VREVVLAEKDEFEGQNNEVVTAVRLVSGWYFTLGDEVFSASFGQILGQFGLAILEIATEELFEGL